MHAPAKSAARTEPEVAGPANQAGLVEPIQAMVRLTLPFDAKVVVVSDGDPRLLDLEGRQTWHFPQTAGGVYAGHLPLNAPQAVEHLEDLRAKGAQYLLIPATSLWWLDHYMALRRHLSQRYRVVRYDPAVGMIVALHGYLDLELRDEGAEDGFPLPPPEMIALVIGSYGVKGFLSGGIQVANLISTTLERNGISMDTLRGILDFGCGSGRVMRRWAHLADRGLRGVDYNPYLVEWCQKTLPHARFDQNTFPDPLPLGDESVDLAYSYSIFTHLDATSQSFWMSELTRVLRPGAHLLLTVHGSAYVDGLSSEDREKFEDGQMLVKQADLSGSNACYVLHPREYVEDVLAQDFELIDFVPGGSESPETTELKQDALLLRKGGG